jgi:hypothetical protein
MIDPAFIEEADKLRLDMTVMGAEETAGVVGKLFATPPAVTARLKNLIEAK